MERKPRTPIDFIKDLTERKTPWSSLSENDQKGFSVFIINLFLSMNPDLVEFINDLQRYTIGQLTSEQVYKLYLDLLPKSKLPFCKFIKATKGDKYNPELVKLIANHFYISKRIACEYINLYISVDKEKLRDIVKLYGKTEKEITALTKYE